MGRFWRKCSFTLYWWHYSHCLAISILVNKRRNPVYHFCLPVFSIVNTSQFHVFLQFEKYMNPTTALCIWPSSSDSITAVSPRGQSADSRTIPCYTMRWNPGLKPVSPLSCHNTRLLFCTFFTPKFQNYEYVIDDVCQCNILLNWVRPTFIYFSWKQTFKLPCWRRFSSRFSG